MSALSWDTQIISPFRDSYRDCREELISGPRTLPNGQRISGERRAEGDERVRCMRVLGGPTTYGLFTPAPAAAASLPQADS